MSQSALALLPRWSELTNKRIPAPRCHASNTCTTGKDRVQWIGPVTLYYFHVTQQTFECTHERWKICCDVAQTFAWKAGTRTTISGALYIVPTYVLEPTYCEILDFVVPQFYYSTTRIQRIRICGFHIYPTYFFGPDGENSNIITYIGWKFLSQAIRYIRVLLYIKMLQLMRYYSRTWIIRDTDIKGHFFLVPALLKINAILSLMHRI